MPAPDADARVNGLAIVGGQVFVLVRSPLAEQAGLWLLAEGGALVRRASLPANAALNGLTSNPAGDFFATDDQAGIVYRIAFGAAAGEIYAADPLLAPIVDGSSSYGGNGIRYFQGSLYVTNSSRSLFLRLRPAVDGGAVTTEVVATAPALGRVDDFAFDCAGNAYLASLLDDSVVQLTPEGAFTTLVGPSSGLLHQPTSVAFGTGPYAQTLFVTNGAFYRTAAPSVVRLVAPGGR